MSEKRNSSEDNRLIPLFPEEPQKESKDRGAPKSEQKNIQNLFLIDANSMIHRAFHALPVSLRNSKGEIVNAAYGFAGMLIKIIKDFSPDAIVAAFDTKEPTFRHKAYEEYKANRPETADELVPQFKLAKTILDSFDIPVIEMPGFEADDIIATLALQASKSGMKVFIVSSDRDMLQLVGENIKVITTKKGVSEVKLYDRNAVFERFGVYPEEIPDFLSLKGESSDNIPGVPGIGEKTAAELVRKYGRLEAILERADELKGKKYYQSLIENMQTALKAKELVRLRTDVPLRLEDILRKFSYDEKKVARVFSELEFQSLLNRLSISEPVLDVEFQATEKASQAEFDEVYKEVAKEGVCFLGKIGDTFVLSGTSTFCELKEQSQVQKVIEEDASIVTDSLKELVRYLDKKQIELLEKKAASKKIYDISLLLWLSNPDKKKYFLTDYFTGESFKYYLPDVIGWSQRIFERIRKEGLERVYFDVEIRLPFVLADMEAQGLPVDTEKLYSLKKELEREIENLESEIYNLAGVRFNIDSPKQLSHVLYTVLKIAPPQRTRKKYSTEQQVLLKLANSHPIVEKILSYRELTKLLRTYVEPFMEKVDAKTQRVYGRFLQTGTATGRLSSEDPNLQNLPLKGEFSKIFREAIRCKEGYIFVAADYANIDLRVLAHLSQDEKLVEAFKNDEDIHTKTAVEVLKASPESVDERLRRIAKAINFGIIYGVSPEGLAEQAGITYDEAKAFISEYFSKHPGVKRYLENVIKKAYEEGYVETILGRRRYLPGLKSSSVAERNASQRLAMNTPIQGSAADIVKLAMLSLYEKLRKENLQAKIVLQVHDSLVVEAEKAVSKEVAEILKESMENACKLTVPLKVSVKFSESLAGL